MRLNVPGRTRPIATPRARRTMATLGIDPTGVVGSGPNGRITEADVVRFHANPAASPSVAVSPMRLAIARRTAESFATIPHVYLRSELDATALIALRAQLLDSVQRDHGLRLTLTDFLVAAMGRALADCPWANRVWRDQGLIEFPTVDLALHVAVEAGLLVPVIRRVETLGLVELAKERTRLVAAARTGKLPASALDGGAASVSNLGNSRVDEFGAVIMPRQSSILAVGQAVPRPFVVDGLLSVRTTLRLCLAIDHRVMDGHDGARFLGKIVEYLEKPALLL